MLGPRSPPDTPEVARGPSLDTHTTTQIKQIFRDFLSCLGYRSPHTPVNTKLRSDITKMVTSWDIGVDSSFIAAVTETGCCITECAYGHIPYENQLLVASYTVLALCVDDLTNIDALGQVGRWVAAREAVTDPALARFLLQTRDMYDYYSAFNADAINIATLDGILGTAIERATKDKGDLRIEPGNTLYADFVRRKTGVGSAYALFNFDKGWRDSSDLRYLQLVP